MKVTLVLALLATPLPPSVTFGGKYLFKVKDAAQISTDTTCVFDDVPAGDYTATCQALDSAGNPLGEAVMAAFTVPAAPPVEPPPTGTYLAPSGLTVTLG